MMTVEFIRKYILDDGDEQYEFLLNGKPYMYNKTQDTVEVYDPWHTIDRLDMRIDAVEAFNKAWNPVYTDARIKPEGEPVALKNRKTGTTEEYYETVFNNVRPTLNERGQQHSRYAGPWYTVVGGDDDD